MSSMRSPFLFRSSFARYPPGGATFAKGCQFMEQLQSGKGRYGAHRKELPKILEKFKKTETWHWLMITKDPLHSKITQ